MNKSVLTKDLFNYYPVYLTKYFEESTYPWELLTKIKDIIFEIIPYLKGYTEISQGVYVGENVKIYPNVVIEGPAIIGSNTQIRPGAFVRHNVIVGEGSVIGNSTELKNCILLDKVQVPHYNYIGDSVLGNYAHMGAGAICSNCKADGTSVVIHSNEDYPTGLQKVGSFLGDNAEIGCGCVLNPGTVIGKGSRVYPLVNVRGVIGDGYIVKSMDNIVKIK